MTSAVAPVKKGLQQAHVRPNRVVRWRLPYAVLPAPIKKLGHVGSRYVLNLPLTEIRQCIGFDELLNVRNSPLRRSLVRIGFQELIKELGEGFAADGQPLSHFESEFVIEILRNSPRLKRVVRASALDDVTRHTRNFDANLPVWSLQVRALVEDQPPIVEDLRVEFVTVHSEPQVSYIRIGFVNSL